MATRKKAPLGKNLNALLGKVRSSHAASRRPTARPARTARSRPADRADPAGRVPAAHGHGPGSARGAGRVDQGPGCGPARGRALLGAGKGYELIAGERRWRASQKAGLSEIPAVIRDVPDEVTLAMALIENIQRENLNPIEEATALSRLIEEFELTHEQAAANVGRSRASVSNLLRLLDLEPKVRELVDAKKIEMGHARALLALTGPVQVEAARQVATLGLSVRETEALVKRMKDGGGAKKPKPKPDPDIQRLEQELTETLCAPVAVRHSASGKGQVTIKYTSLDELDGLLERFRR
jgi:ParB family chromosome partitioning protein